MKVISLSFIIFHFSLSTTLAQERKVQNKPYIDLRPMHFGILVGMNLQDIEFQNVGPQTVMLEDGTETQQTILCDEDRWNSGFSVGVMADLRLNAHLNLRFAPTMHFGAKHLVFHNLSQRTAEDRPTEVRQDLKSTYISLPIDLKFSAERWNNYRPYLIAGVNPMLNLKGKDQDYIQLKRMDTFLEIGMGCDFYLPFFKLRPELKFMIGLTNALSTEHQKTMREAETMPYAASVDRIKSKMFVLSFYFE